jgi:uncharacterized membrane protein
VSLLFGVLALAAGTLVAFALLALAIAAMRRDARHGTTGTLSSAMLEVQSLLEPAKRHTVEVIRDESRDEDDAAQ